MVSVKMFVEFVKSKDLGRIKFAIKETHFDLDVQDEVSRCFIKPPSRDDVRLDILQINLTAGVERIFHSNTLMFMNWIETRWLCEKFDQIMSD